MRPRSLPPLWFQVAATIALLLALRALDAALGGALLARGDGPDVQVGFWAFLAAIVGAIFKGLQVAGKVTLTVLQWSVKALWLFATVTANALKVVGHAFLVGFKKAWEFLRLTYDKVLKPGLLKFWHWFDKFAHWLDHTFKPVLEWLKIVRDHVMAFYKTWVRPWLDLIDVTRRTLRIFSALGLDWARRLDAKLGQIQELIDRPFRLVLGKLNEVINIVNRIVTVDGLIQRFALIRSLGRDYRFVWDAITAPYNRPPTEGDKKVTQEIVGKRTLAQATGDFPKAVQNEGGPHHALVAEMQVQWRLYIERR